MDQGTGLTYMQQRYYDPLLQRFFSNDPVATNPNTGASFNRYWYANDNPYRFTDPDGRMTAEDRKEQSAVRRQQHEQSERERHSGMGGAGPTRSEMRAAQSNAGAQLREDNAQALATTVQASANGGQIAAVAVGAAISADARAAGHAAEVVAEGAEAGKYAAKRLGIVGVGFAFAEVLSPKSRLLDRGHGLATLTVDLLTLEAPMLGVGYSMLDMSVQAQYGGWLQAGAAGAIAAPDTAAAFPMHPMQNP